MITHSQEERLRTGGPRAVVLLQAAVNVCTASCARTLELDSESHTLNRLRSQRALAGHDLRRCCYRQNKRAGDQTAQESSMHVVSQFSSSVHLITMSLFSDSFTEQYLLTARSIARSACSRSIVAPRSL